MNYNIWKADSSSKSEAKHGGIWSHSCAYSWVRGQLNFYNFSTCFLGIFEQTTKENTMKRYCWCFSIGNLLNFGYLGLKGCNIIRKWDKGVAVVEVAATSNVKRVKIFWQNANKMLLIPFFIRISMSTKVSNIKRTP